MHGTWKVTGIPLASLAVIGMAAAAGSEGALWLLARVWWILGSLAACGLIATWAAPKIARRVDGNAAGIWIRQAGVDDRAPLFMSGPTRQVGAPARAAISGGTHYHFYGDAAVEAAARAARGELTEGQQQIGDLIAIPGQAGDAVTEGNGLGATEVRPE